MLSCVLEMGASCGLRAVDCSAVSRDMVHSWMDEPQLDAAPFWHRCSISFNSVSKDGNENAVVPFPLPFLPFFGLTPKVSEDLNQSPEALSRALLRSSMPPTGLPLEAVICTLDMVM